MEDILDKDNLHTFLHKQYNNNNSFIANINKIAKEIQKLIELNDKFPQEVIDRLTDLYNYLDRILILLDSLGMIQEVYDGLPQMQELYEAISTIPEAVEQMLNDVKKAFEDWNVVEVNILPQIQELRGIFTSVNIWNITAPNEITAGTYIKVPAYNYSLARLFVLLNGVSTLEFDKTLPITSGNVNSEYITFRENIPANTQIVGMTFLSPTESTTIPSKVIHDDTLIGEGNGTEPLGINTEILAGITVNSNAIGSLQARASVLEEELETTNGNVLANQLAIDTLSDTVADLPTTEEIAEVVEQATTERTYLSDARINATSTGATLALDTLSSKGSTGSLSRAFPIASVAGAGLIPASVYSQLLSMQTQLDGLTGSAITVIDDTLASDASQTDLNTAWNSSGNALVDGSTLENNTLELRWIYRGSQWYGPYTFTAANVASATQLGVVKGVENLPENYGQIFVELDGSQSLLGYDAIISAIDSLSTSLTARLNSLETNVNTNVTDINSLKTKTDTTNSNLTLLTNRVTVAESNINTHKGKEWTILVSLTPPYVANTAISIPAYPINKDALVVYINGVRTNRFTELSTTTIGLNEGISGSNNIELLIDCFKV